ncbi:Uracil permease, partial [Jeotgalibacillus marinus]
YNEQPYCELVKADFFELDFSPCHTGAHETFDKLREKIVLDLTVKVLQLQQVQVGKLPKDKC